MKRVLTMILAISVLITVCAAGTIFAQDKTVVLACSDFQPEQGNNAGKTVLESLLCVLKNKGITSADGFLCCGDYDYEYSETREGIDTIKEAVRDVVDSDMVFVQGNHDSGIGTNGISKSGNNDPASGKYGVFVINEDDYMWNNSNRERIKQTAQNLIDYLNKKLKAKYDKPVFVVSHLPLNYSMRTANDGDAMYANYIFDALNEAGGKGLNIVYLFGHDHSNGWDDYLGGAAIYLEKGDKILIARNSKTVFDEKTLEFTYMNAGYVGYYGLVNDGADGTLTMTSFEFDENELTVSRYDTNGIHNLKSAGVRNAYKNESAYSPDTTVYASPRKITLTEVTDTSPIEDILEKPKPEFFDEKYVRITSVDMLEDGGKYLLVYNSGTDYIMLPRVKTTERIGFDLEATSAFGNDTVKGDYNGKLWTLNKSNGRWTLESGGKYAALTNTSTHKITATLEDTATEFKIEGNADYFSFIGDKYMLNYNSRGLINGYNADPALFYIYKYQKDIDLKTEKTESGIACELTVSGVDSDVVIIVAAYLDKKMVCTPAVVTGDSKGKTFTVQGRPDTFKIFVWNGSDSISPLIASKIVAMQI